MALREEHSAKTSDSQALTTVSLRLNLTLSARPCTYIMSTFTIAIPVPSMGATVHELTIVKLVAEIGAKVVKGQKLAVLESDKSIFDFESPGDGVVVEICAKDGEIKQAGEPLFRMQTEDETLRHLAAADGGGAATTAASAALVWTPKALKLAQEAGVDPTKAEGIAATGPGGRVSGDDVTRWLANRK